MTDEEKRIVEWLREQANKAEKTASEKSPLLKQPYFAFEAALNIAANQIERGDHMKGINNG